MVRKAVSLLVVGGAIGFAAALVARACGPRLRPLRLGRLVGLAWMSHLMVDLLTVDSVPPAGMACSALIVRLLTT